MSLRIKRVYDAPTISDGFRVLVDRLWPRGLTTERAHLDLWLKEVAPSPDLRVWWDHDPARFKAFAERYQSELDRNPAVRELEAALTTHRTVTLVYGARDTRVNHAAVLAQFLVNAVRGDSTDG